MTDSKNLISPAEIIALWADKLRDLSAAGLNYSENVYDKNRYEAIQEMAMEMLAFATAQPLESITPLKETVFSRMSPVVAGAAVDAQANGDARLSHGAHGGNAAGKAHVGGGTVGDACARIGKLLNFGLVEVDTVGVPDIVVEPAQCFGVEGGALTKMGQAKLGLNRR